MTVDRKTLYEEVWKEPMTKVAARYGVSSSFLARVCVRPNVPRPARGHYTKLRYGKAIIPVQTQSVETMDRTETKKPQNH